MSLEEISYGNAIREALYDEMQQDNNVVMLGEDIRYNLYAYTEGMLEAFGEERVIDIPLSESAVVGTAIGAAMCGLRPIVDLTISNFMYVAMDQLVSMAAKMTYQYNGNFRLPLTILASSAYGASAGAQHSDRPHPMFMNVPGLKVIAPATVQDTYSMIRTAVQDDNPVLCFFDKIRFYEKDILDKHKSIALGKAQIMKKGNDITLVGIQNCANIMHEIAKEFEDKGINAEVINVRSLVPLDKNTIFESVKKTGKLVIADTANRTCSAAAQISSLVAEEIFSYLKAPIRIVATQDVPLPFSHELEKELIPTKEKMIHAVNDVLNYKK